MASPSHGTIARLPSDVGVSVDFLFRVSLHPLTLESTTKFTGRHDRIRPDTRTHDEQNYIAFGLLPCAM